MGYRGRSEDAMARQGLRKVLKPFTGKSEDGIPVLLGGGWEQARGFSRGRLSFLALFGKTSEKALVLEAVNTLAILLTFACFAPSAFPLSFLGSVLFLSSFSPNSWCELFFLCPTLSSRTGHTK